MMNSCFSYLLFFKVGNELDQKNVYLPSTSTSTYISQYFFPISILDRYLNNVNQKIMKGKVGRSICSTIL